MRSRVGRVLVLVGVLGLVLGALYLLGSPGSLLALKNADGSVSHRDAAGALVGLLVLGLMALGLDLQDWL